ncbi:SCP2 sterol-binding domain-containing protein [Notoacmeibacter sp. MSK16QG-6]|uniref:SCP2 sterol-binding domain-containing protein n=1 Tax=Notoacmeibacter sp. MSK16QG-6 TaxID=2957982 RepID=UPI0020A060DC|nr:SCP2 sterol-binding domain-containing protein [Notoacmeibacter sp. MSK16QG-6]MCP1200392.1 SCP2 sterol-binding domain-containing protein [Notoacmeibacter sp. MSK16QG-6]
MAMDDIAEKIRPAVKESDFSDSVKFDCGSDGVMVIDGNEVTTDDKPADCTITMEKSDLEDMIAGDLDATQAFMSGKLKVDGDMGVAMKLQQLF